MKAPADHHHHHHSSTPPPATKISIPISAAAGGAEAALLGKGRYKAWALAAIALLALWSMFAASVTIRWSSGDLAAEFGDLPDPLIDDLDPLVCLPYPNIPFLPSRSCRHSVVGA
jgi:hypothetical protein